MIFEILLAKFTLGRHKDPYMHSQELRSWISTTVEDVARESFQIGYLIYVIGWPQPNQRVIHGSVFGGMAKYGD